MIYIAENGDMSIIIDSLIAYEKSQGNLISLYYKQRDRVIELENQIKQYLTNRGHNIWCVTSISPLASCNCNSYRVNKLAKENESLEKEIEALKIKNSQPVVAVGYVPEEKYDELKKENAKLRIMVETPTTIVPESDLREAQDENRELEKENQKLVQNNKRLNNLYWKHSHKIEDLEEENDELKKKIENQKAEIKNLEKAYRKEKDIRKTDQIHWGRQKKEFNEAIATLKAQLGRKDCKRCGGEGGGYIAVSENAPYELPRPKFVKCHDCDPNTSEFPVKEDRSQTEFCEVSGAKLDAFNAQAHDFDECPNHVGKNGEHILCVKCMPPQIHETKPDNICTTCEGNGKLLFCPHMMLSYPWQFLPDPEWRSCEDCNGTGKNERFLSQPLESIINHKFIIKEFGGFKIGDFIKCKRSTARTILRDRLLLTNPATWDVDIKRVMNLIDETLSKYGLKFSE